MENPELFYLSADEYAEKSLVPNLVNDMEDEQIEELLLEAMIEIDSYIGDGWIKLDEDQEFIFPRDTDVDEDEDDEPFIPRAVQIATRLVADAIARKRGGKILPHEVSSESRLGRSYSRRTQAASEVGYEHWPPEVFSKLDRFRQFGGQLAVACD